MKMRFVNFIASILKPKTDMVPPDSMIFVGGGDFKKIGQEYKNYFIEFGHLKPYDRVLDVGCGIGRMAIPLTAYLNQEGAYYGFDIVKDGIKWCQNHISPKFSNFHFQHSDVYNKHYNPAGKNQAQNFKFPFSDEYFDFIFLTSVFTHMGLLDLENYLAEISRVIKQGGRCLITFFLLNKESMHLIGTGRSPLNFKYEINGCLTIDADDPESAIAYDESFIGDLLAKYKLRIIQPIHYGSWCDREAYLSYQDIVIAIKE